MIAANVQPLLQAWEAGVSASASLRALLMLSVAAPQEAPDVLAELSVGHRNAHLLTLREQVFGATIEGLTQCPACAERIELTFTVADIRANHAEVGATFHALVDDHDVTFRVPTSADLLLVEQEPDWTRGERRLLERCVLTVATSGSAVLVDDLPSGLAVVVAERMEEIDRQAVVVLDVACPSCGTSCQPSFDVAGFVWAEVDAWARTLLHDVHSIATAYGWSESSILSMVPARRRAYLDQIRA